MAALKHLRRALKPVKTIPMNKPVEISTNAQVKAKKGPTPMMAQYLSIKAEIDHDVILFYRMGDFYEMFFKDAVNASAALGIALTKRGKHEGGDIPMCGVPVHASETYLQRLIKAGFRVAVCEQTENPAESKKRGHKSVVRRAIVRLVTPGTLTEDSLLDARKGNTIVCIAAIRTGEMALAWADISVGSFNVCHVAKERLTAEICALAPREILLSETFLADHSDINNFDIEAASLTPLSPSLFNFRSAQARIQARYNVDTLDGFGDYTKPEIIAAGVMLDYLELTQAGDKVQLSPPKRRSTSEFMSIDPATRTSLEIDRSLSPVKGVSSGSLLSVIDKTVTGPGARLLNQYVSRPLLDPARINARLDAVDYFYGHDEIREQVRAHLKRTHDPARALSRLMLGRGGPRDLKAIASALREGEFLNASFAKQGNNVLPKNLNAALSQLSLARQAELSAIVGDIKKALRDEAPLMARDGGIINEGWSRELDDALKLRMDSRLVIAELQGRYAKLTGVQSLKIKHNNVLGYFIDITPKHGDVLLSGPHKDIFIHRQTLVSGIRFTSPELVELDTKISGAASKALAIELNIYEQFCTRLQALSKPVRSAAQALAKIDVMSGLGEWARADNAVRPVVNSSTKFDIEGGRHPVVAAALTKEGGPAFTVNDCQLDAGGAAGVNRLTLITGPNMAGKSTYLRQNALMFILAQSGCFVPARRAEIGIADALFSRVGASDDLSRGRSTFMTEMIETAAILNQATPRTFVILDEIGRGTSTFDGLAIAWATTEHLHTVNMCRALFATHYHELTALVDTLGHAGNASLRAKEWEGDLVFLHDVKPGPADKSYGVQVAKLAGLPPAAILRARDVLERLESEANNNKQGEANILGGLPLFSAPTPPLNAKPSKIDLAVQSLEIDDLSPREALEFLYDLKSLMHKKTNKNAGPT